MSENKNLSIKSFIRRAHLVQYKDGTLDTNVFGDVKELCFEVIENNPQDASKTLRNLYVFYYTSWPTESEIQQAKNLVVKAFEEDKASGKVTTVIEMPKVRYLKYV